MGSWKRWIGMCSGMVAVLAVAAWGYVHLTRTIPEEIKSLPWAVQVSGVELEAVHPSWSHGMYAVYRIEGDREISRVYWRWRGDRFECEK